MSKEERTKQEARRLFAEFIESQTPEVENYVWRWEFTESGAFVDHDNDEPELAAMYRVLGRKYYWARRLFEGGRECQDFRQELEEGFRLLSEWVDKKYGLGDCDE